MKVCIVGLGNMGTAIHDALKAKGFDVDGFDNVDDPNEYLPDADAVVLAVKPQDFENLCEDVEIDMGDKLIVSIMAGVSVAKISKGLRVEKVIRVMPNLPLKVGHAMSGWFASEYVGDKGKEFVKKMLMAFGDELEVDDESKIDAITALSGSGPAYFYKLAELLGDAAKKYGFNEREARKIAENTFIGSAILLEDSESSVAELRERVTSKGGTTEAALNYMDKKGLEGIVKDGVEAARKRAKELNK